MLANVSGCIPDIICVAQITLKFIDHALIGGLLLLPQPTSPRDIQASFKKAYWKSEPLLLSDSKKDLACATLRSIALNYRARLFT